MRAFFGTDRQAPLVSLSENGKILGTERGEKGDDPLAVFDRALRAAQRKTEGLREIAVDRGPDGFSTVRRRIAAAMSLASALRLPVAAVEGLGAEEAAKLPGSAFALGAAVLPAYDRAPNITEPKKKSPKQEGKV